MYQDFSDLLHELSAHNVEFLVVGVYALAGHGHVRATETFELWVRPDSANAKRVIQALVAFGAPLQDLREEDLAQPGVIFQIGVSPIRIDILTEIDGVEFSEAWNERVATLMGGQPVSVLSRRHLIANKRATGRSQDLADIEQLEKIVGDE